MWGDDPDDFKKRQMDERGMLAPDLPTSENINDDWTVDLEWVFSIASLHPIACITTGVRYTGEGFQLCPEWVQDAATQMARELFARYQKFVANQSAST